MNAEQAPPYVADYFDERGLRLAETNPNDFRRLSLFYEREAMLVRDEVDATIAAQSIEKPEWLQQCESDAKEFCEAIGLISTADIYLIEGEHHHEPDEISELAEYFDYQNIIFLYADRLKVLHDLYGTEHVIRTIVHEIAHASAYWTYQRVYHKSLSPNEASLKYRCGFAVSKNEEIVGQYFEEAFAEYCARIYVKQDSTHEPTYLRLLPTVNPRKYEDEYMPSDLDGYSLQLIEGMLEKRGLVRTGEFLETLIATRKPESRVFALRKFADLVNSLEPGLYRRLQNVEYSEAAFSRAYQYIYTLAVTSAANKIAS
jgi:hypothetical protein